VITVLFYMTVNEGRDNEFAELAKEMMRSTRSRDAGCITYAIHREIDAPRKFVLYEQWRDEDAINAHLARLMSEIGRERFVAFFETTSALRLQPIE
jgi:quinol monooxygenase YgiN